MGSMPPPPAPAGQAPTTMRCYKHADREAGRRCTRCGKPACSSCLVQAAVGSHCLDCAKAAQPDLKTRARFWSARQPVLMTTILIGINAVIFIAILLISADPAALSGSATNAHLDLGLSRQVLEERILWQGDDGSIYITEPYGWYRLVASGFLHFGLIHIGLNMFFLYVLGPMLEPALGRVRFLLLYFAALLGGSLGVVLLDKGGISAGASGAVFGLMAAAAVGQWRRGINPMSTGIGATLLLNLVITFAIPGISIGGHLGGAIAGAICGAVMLAPAYQGIPKWATYVTPIAVGIGSVIAVVAITS
jgi:membrane associated rhomboid family serine protease